MRQNYLEWEKYGFRKHLTFNPRLKTGIRAVICLSTILFLLLSFPSTRQACASEGGSTGYTPGTFSDFAMNIFQPGLSIRENIFHYYGTLDDLPPAGGLAQVELEATAWVNLLQAVWATKDFKLLGGRYFANINIPVGFDMKITTTLGAPLSALSGEETDSGLGDIQLVPFGLVWDRDNYHFMAAENIIMPTGKYDEDKTANMGRNYWAFDTLFGFTWLHPTRGHEISFTMGYMTSQENSKTDYKTGDEFHIDYTLAQYLSKEFGAGLIGYYYTQTTDDSGSGYDAFNDQFLGRLDGYRSSGAGIGPGLVWVPKVGGRSLNLIAKWIYEYEAKNRAKGGWVYISAAMSF